MANLLGSSIQSSLGSISAEQLGAATVANTLSVTVAQATNDLLGPALAAKAPKHNPVFTGNVTGVSANMITTDNQGNVQSELNKKVNNSDAEFVGDVTINPRTGFDYDTALTIKSTGLASANPVSALNLDSANKRGTISFNDVLGMSVTTSDTAPLFLRSGTGSAYLFFTPDKLTNVGPMDIRGDITTDVNLIGNTPNGAVQMKIRNINGTGVSRISLGPGADDQDYGRINYRNDAGLWMSTPRDTAISFSPNGTRVADIKKGESTFFNPVVCEQELTTNNVSLERRMVYGGLHQWYGNLIYGVPGANPDYWAKLEWYGWGLMPAYGRYTLIDGGYDPVTDLPLSMWGEDLHSYHIKMDGTYNFQVYLKIESRRVTAKTVKQYVLRLLCDTPTKSKINLGESDVYYFPPFNFSNVDCHVIGVHLPKGSKVWAEMKAVYVADVAREDDKIYFNSDGSFFRCHLVN